MKLCISSLCINGYAKESPPLHPLLQANYSFTADKMRLIKEPKYELRARLQKYNIYIDILENYAFQRIVVCKKMALEGMKRNIMTGTLCNTIEQWDSDMQPRQPRILQNKPLGQDRINLLIGAVVGCAIHMICSILSKVSSFPAVLCVKASSSQARPKQMMDICVSLPLMP